MRPTNQELRNEKELTSEEAAEMLHISKKTLIEWVKYHRYKKYLAPIRYNCRVVRYRESQLLEFKRKCMSIY